MEPSEFSIPFREVMPHVIKGCGIVQITHDQRCSALCALAFTDSPFGQFEECVSFAYDDEDARENAQLFGISSKPKLSRAAYPLADNSHYLMGGSMRMTTRQNLNKKACMMITAHGEPDLLRFEIVAARMAPTLPLVPITQPATILGLYAEKRFGSFHALHGTFHRARVLSESFDSSFQLNGATDDSLSTLAARISDEFPRAFFSGSERTFIVDSFSILVPERKGSRAFSIEKNKRVTSSYACDS